MQHQQRRSNRRKRRQRACEPVAKRLLDCKLCDDAARNRQPGETQGQQAGKRRQPFQAGRSAPRQNADREKQPALRKTMMGRVKRGSLGGAGVSRCEARAERRCDETHLAHARIGQHGFRVPLRETDGDAVKGSEPSERGERLAPRRQRLIEREETHEPDDAGVDGAAAQNRSRRDRSGAVSRGHPDMQRKRADLASEAEDQQADRRATPRRRVQVCDAVGDEQASIRSRRREQRKGENQKGLPEQRDREIQTARVVPGARPCDDKAIGRQTDEREEKIKAREIRRHEHADIADQRREPEGNERAATHVVVKVSGGEKPGRAPQKGGHAQQQRAWPIEDEDDRIDHLIDDERPGIMRQKGGCKGEKRRDRQIDGRKSAKARRSAGEQKQERNRKGQGERLRPMGESCERGKNIVAHSTLPIAAGAPTSSKDDSSGGANPRTIAKRARAMASATPPGVRLTGAECPVSAGATASAITR